MARTALQAITCLVWPGRHVLKSSLKRTLTQMTRTPSHPLSCMRQGLFSMQCVWDTRTYVYRIPFSKTFNPQQIAQAYEKGSMNEVRHILGVGELQTAHRKPHGECTNNHTYFQSHCQCSFLQTSRSSLACHQSPSQRYRTSKSPMPSWSRCRLF